MYNVISMTVDSSGSKLRAPVTLLGTPERKVQAVDRPGGEYGTDLVVVEGAPKDPRKLVEGLNIPEGVKLLDLGLGTDWEVRPAVSRRYKDTTVALKRRSEDGVNLPEEEYHLSALLYALSKTKISGVNLDGAGQPSGEPAGVAVVKDLKGEDHCLVMRSDSNYGYTDPSMLPGQLMVELVKEMLSVEAKSSKFNLGLKSILKKMEKVDPRLKDLLLEPEGIARLIKKQAEPVVGIQRYYAMSLLCGRLARYMGDKDAVEKARPKEVEGNNDWREDLDLYDHSKFLEKRDLGVIGTPNSKFGNREKSGSVKEVIGDYRLRIGYKMVVPSVSGAIIAGEHLKFNLYDIGNGRLDIGNTSENKECNVFYLTEDGRWAPLISERSFQLGQTVCLQIRDKKGKEALAIIAKPVDVYSDDGLLQINGGLQLGYRDMKKRPLLLEEIEAGKAAKREKVEATKAKAEAEAAKAARIKQEAEEKAKLVAQEAEEKTRLVAEERAKMSEIERQKAAEEARLEVERDALRAEQREIEDKQLLSKAEEKGWISLKNASAEKKAEILEKMRKEGGEVKYDHIVAIPDPWGKELVIGRALDPSEPLNQLGQTDGKFRLSIIPDEDPPEGIPEGVDRRVSSNELRIVLRSGITICAGEPQEYRFSEQRYAYYKDYGGTWRHIRDTYGNEFMVVAQTEHSVVEFGIRDYGQTDKQAQTEGPKHRIRVTLVEKVGDKVVGRNDIEYTPKIPEKLIVEW